MENIILNTPLYNDIECDVVFSTYTDSGRTALLLRDRKDDFLIDISKNMPDHAIIDKDYIFVKDYGENHGMFEAIVELGLIEDMVYGHVESGFVSMPIAKLTPLAQIIRDKQKE